MSNSIDSYHIRYGNFDEPKLVMQRVAGKMQKVYEGLMQVNESFHDGGELQHVMSYDACAFIHVALSNAYKDAVGLEISLSPQSIDQLKAVSRVDMLDRAAEQCRDNEVAVMAALAQLVDVEGTGGVAAAGLAGASFADQYYQSYAQKQKNEQEAQGKAEEEAKRQAEAEAEKAAKLAAMMALLGQLCPEAAEELQWQMWDAQMQELIDYYRNGEGNNPALADQIEAEWEAKKKAREDAKRAAAEAEAAAIAEAERQRTLEWLAENSPEAYQEYLKRLAAEDEKAALAWLKEHDPELYEAVMKERAKAAKEAAEAARLAQEAEAAGAQAGLEDGLGGLGLGDSDVGGAGGGGLGSLGSDVDGAGGGGLDFGDSGLGSDWASEDWASDMLDDALDTGELDDASSALGDALGGAADDALSAGAEAAGDAADLDEATGIWAQYGPQLASVVQAYGLQAAAVTGGAAALYATREQTTEAVAHVAEFVSTKCKPAVNDVMDQVRGAARQTRVSVSRAKSAVTAAARGERAGDLVG